MIRNLKKKNCIGIYGPTCILQTKYFFICLQIDFHHNNTKHKTESLFMNDLIVIRDILSIANIVFIYLQSF